MVSAVLAALALPVSASAFSWEEPTRFNDPPGTTLGFPTNGVESAMNAAGVTEVAWDASDIDSSNPWEVRNARRAATGGWAAPMHLAGANGGVSAGHAPIVDIAVEPDGDTVALLGGANPDTGSAALYISVKPNGGAWSEAVRLSANEAGDVVTYYGVPELLIDGTGSVAVFYGKFSGPGSGYPRTIRRADWDTDTPSTAPTDTTIDTATGVLSDIDPIKPMSFDMNASGGAVAVFDDSTESGRMYALTKGSVGGWSSLTDIGPSSNQPTGFQVSAGVDQNSNAHVIVNHCVGEGQSMECLHEAKKPAAGSWSSFTAVPHFAAFSGPNSGPLTTYLAPDGKAVLVIKGGTQRATMAYSGGSWSAPVVMPELDLDDSTIGAVIDSSGTEHVIGRAFSADTGLYSLWALRRPAGGAFGSPEEVDTQSAMNHIFSLEDFMIDADGEPVVVYQKHDGLMSSRGGDFPKAEVTPGSLDFGSLELNSPASKKTLTLKNTGDALLDISGVELNGPFTRNDPDCFGDDLAPGESCEIEISFEATDTSPKSGSLVFTHNAVGTPTTVQLAGDGHNPRGNPQLNATELQFGSRRVGSVFPEDGFQGIPATLTNAGPGPIHITSVTVPAPFEATNPVGCNGVTLAANHSCTVFVKFRPTQVGESVETLSFVTDDLASPHQFTLRGTGTPVPGGGEGQGGDSNQPTPQEAGSNDAQTAGQNAPGTFTASAFDKTGITLNVNATLQNTGFRNQTNALIGEAGSNLIGEAGTNLIGEAGSNLIGEAGTNLIGEAGSNRLALRKSQSIPVKCPTKVLKKNKKAKCKIATLASGNLFLPLPGPGTLTVKPTSAGRKLLKQAMAYAKAQKKKGKKGKKVKPLTLSFATLVRPGGPTAPGYYTVEKLTIKP